MFCFIVEVKNSIFWYEIRLGCGEFNGVFLYVFLKSDFFFDFKGI